MAVINFRLHGFSGDNKLAQQILNCQKHSYLILHLFSICIAIKKLKNPNNSFVRFLDSCFVLIPQMLLCLLVCKINELTKNFIYIDNSTTQFIIRFFETLFDMSITQITSLLLIRFSLIKPVLLSTIYYRIGRFGQIINEQLSDRNNTLRQKAHNVLGITTQETLDQLHEIVRQIRNGMQSLFQ
jgi:hypothetical protein